MTLRKALRNRWISEELFDNWAKKHETSTEAIVRSELWSRMLLWTLGLSMLSSLPVAYIGAVAFDNIIGTIAPPLLLSGGLGIFILNLILKPRFRIHNDFVFAIDFLRRELMFAPSDKLEFWLANSRAQIKLPDLAYLVLKNEQVLDDHSASYEERAQAGKDRERYKEAFNSLHGVCLDFGFADEKDVYYAKARKRLVPTIH